MTRQIKGKTCKICRRLGTKLFLKGEKCLSSKCALLRKPYPPGFGIAKKRQTPLSEFGKILREKQKIKNLYNFKEYQLKRLVSEAIKKRKKVGDLASYFIELLELRLENVVFQAGFCLSRKQARQLVLHRYFLVNGRIMPYPSFLLKVGDIVSLNEKKKNKKVIEIIKKNFEKKQLPSWLEKQDNFQVKVSSLVKKEEVALPADVSHLFEFYSK